MKSDPGALKSAAMAASLLLCCALLAAEGTSESPLAGTEWRLVQFQSMDGAIGTVEPEDPSLYTMRLNADGTVSMRLNCNRANGTWSVEPGPDGTSGRFQFGPLAATTALCSPPSLDEHIRRHAEHVRGYILRGGRLHLSLFADGGIYTWEPDDRTAIATAASASNPARTEGPAFDCTKADGAVEELICRDEDLAALDRKLDGVYKAALARAGNERPPVLKAEQRGWIKGRNDCWKAQGADNPVFLTGSWRATSERDCIEGQYRLRTSELEARYRLVPAKGPVFYACQGNPSNEIVATFFETDPPVALVERGDRTVTAWLIRAASGSKYEGRNLELRVRGDEATVTWLVEELECEVKR